MAVFPIPAALAAERDQGFISDALQQWAVAKKPSGSEMCVFCSARATHLTDLHP